MKVRIARLLLVLISSIALLGAPASLVLGASGPAVPAASSAAPTVLAMTPAGPGQSTFSDVPSSHWAYHDICLVGGKGLFRGRADGSFAPEQPVTRLELILLTMRLMGKEREAMAYVSPEEALASLEGSFDDADDIPPWPGALECVAYAEDSYYLEALVDHDGQSDVEFGAPILLRPNDPATRLDVVVTLIDAMDSDLNGSSCHDAVINPLITAPDAGTIPEWARPYVAMASALNLIRGNEVGYLNLGDNVTRAQMAALLARADDMVESSVDDFVIEGRVSQTSLGYPPTITVSALTEEFERYGGVSDTGDEGDDYGGGDGTPFYDSPGNHPDKNAGGTGSEPLERSLKTFEVSPSAIVFRGGAVATLSAVGPGDDVTVILDQAATQAVLVDARAATPTVRPGLRATVDVAGYDPIYGLSVLLDDLREAGYEGGAGYDDGSGYDYGDGLSDGSGYDETTDNRVAVTLTLSTEVRIWVDGELSPDAELGEGDKLVLKFGPDGISDIYVVEFGTGGEGGDKSGTGSGTVEGYIVDASEEYVTVTVLYFDGDFDESIVEGEDAEFSLAPDVTITDAEGQPLDWSDLEVDWYVSLTIEDGEVVEIQVLY